MSLNLNLKLTHLLDFQHGRVSRAARPLQVYPTNDQMLKSGPVYKTNSISEKWWMELPFHHLVLCGLRVQEVPSFPKNKQTERLRIKICDFRYQMMTLCQ